jgi:hypothetical protein
MTTPCTYWRKVESTDGGHCSHHNATVSFGVCNTCNLYAERQWIQDIQARFKLGDKIKAVTDRLGIEPCGGCRERQARWNGERSPDNQHNNEATT